MNPNFQKLTRLVLIVVLLLTLTTVLSSYSVSRAAANPVAAAEKPLMVDASGSSLPGSILPSSFMQTNPPGFDPELLQRLRQNARGQVDVSARKSTGMAGFVRVSRDGDLLPPARGRGPQGKAIGFFGEYGGLFGIRNPNSEVALVSTSVDALGATHLEYQQVYNNVPVFAAVLRAHVDAEENLSAVNGVFIPDINVDTSPSLSAGQAAEQAVNDVLANPPDSDTGASSAVSAGDLVIESNTLYVYREGLIQDIAGPNILAYEVVVTDQAGVREFVFVDAHSGKVVNRYSGTHGALYRRLFEASISNQVWQEGDPFPGALNQDQQNIVEFTGDSYYLFFNAFDRDSYNGAGIPMQAVNNDPRINCPNANWNGITTNYCNGVTSDDVVAHEWGHAFTEYTHNLIYQWQPGALNESYSDIWGEVVDQLNGAGTDSPDTVRSENSCTFYTAPIPLLRINSPSSIAGDYAAGGASFGPPLTAAGITGSVVLADDGVDVGSDACTPLANAGAINGNIAVVDRGACAFTIKVKNAQDAGATGVIVADNVVGPVAGMSGADPTIVIPSLRVTLATGNLIKSELATGVNATLTVVGSGVREDSYRWLMGEDSSAFGGAIRDMWSPTCQADPGKVSDSQYQCSVSDGGGVHSNSGVPNHGFALLVDGGTYNGQTVNSIGVVKAAHIYWRAQSVYQTPSSNFADHADALETSCRDLVGQNLNGLSTESLHPGLSGQALTAGDCAEVSKMVQAVELRLDPAVQCDFKPVLAQNPPPLCAARGSTPVFKENFEEGLNKWTLTNQGVFSGWPGLDWAMDKTLPGGRKGSAAFAVEPDAGSCDLGANDISGSMSMESPPIKIPSGNHFIPRMAYQHYFATEAGWDGGNLRISINGGPYVLVPASAYIFNPYNMTLQTAAAGNTNPLAGQAAFSGTDGGSVAGSWGQSQIDLAALGVKPGDTIRLRYDFGMDGCTGFDGWYVDDVEVVACRP